MASNPHFISGQVDIFAEPPIKLKVGKRDKIYHVHPGIFTSSALSADIISSWKGTADETVELTEYDEQTIESVLSYFYTKEYFLAQITPESDLPRESDAKPDDSPSVGEDLPVEENTNAENSVHGSATNGNELRPPSPTENIVDQSSPQTLRSTSATHEDAHRTGQILSAEALAHAKIYSFAHKFLMSDLEEFATHRLAKTLEDLQSLKIGISPPLAEAIRLIYDTTPSDAEIPTRKLLSQYAALSSSSSTNDHLDMFFLEGGNFAVDVFHELSRKVDDLMAEAVALELSCSQTREEVSRWQVWNSGLPSKHRRYEY
ncbi:hypothetical protein F1880_004896 [Penicillium rolfsii]|nr:hypothetical protein F1880_004896 [Penicillium rolfsii]